MKTVRDIKARIIDVENFMKTELKEKKTGVSAQSKGKLNVLKTCKMYLESKPSEDFVKKEKDKVSNRIDEIFKEYKPLDRDENSPKQCRQYLTIFEKNWEVPKLRSQLKVLKFILAQS